MTFILLAVLGFYFYNHIRGLENRIQELEEGHRSDLVANPTLNPVPVQQSEVSDIQSEPIHKYMPQEQSSFERFVDWSKEDFMVKAGAFLLILALGWFVNYSVAEQWIGPSGQITIGLLTGSVILMLGAWRIRSHQHQGGIFTVLGATIILLVLFAAREIYDFFTPVSALLMMFTTVVFVAFVSVKCKSERLAYIGVLMASVAPFLTNGHSATVVDLFGYLLIVTLGSLWVVWMTGWTKIILISLSIAFLYSTTFGMVSSSDKDVVMMFTFLFVSIYFVANIVSLLRRHGEGVKHMTNHVLVALGTAIFLVFWIERVLVVEWKSLVYVTWAFIFAVGTYLVYLFTANRGAFYIYGATSIALIGVATAAELTGPSLVLAYLLEICLLVFVAAKLNVGSKLISMLSLLLAIPVTLSFNSFNLHLWQGGIFHEHFVILCITMVAFLAVGQIIRISEVRESKETTISSVMFIGSAFYAVSLVWLVFHALLADDVATMLSLFVYTVAGVSLYVSGTMKNKRGLRVIGGILVGIVLARLMLIEVWDMNLIGRIVTFLVIGIMLMSTAFIKKTSSSDSEDGSEISSR